MFLFLFIFNFILMNTSLEDENLRSSIHILSDSSFQDSASFTARNLAEPAPQEFFDCTKSPCLLEKMACDEGQTVCKCKPQYSTLNNSSPCNYDKKRQLVAFLLELFVGFGGGHFYTERYLEASLKLVAFLFGIYIICLFPITAKCMSGTCNSDCGVILTSCFYYLYSLGLASWFIIDLVWFGKNYYPDGNGQPLAPW